MLERSPPQLPVGLAHALAAALPLVSAGLLCLPLFALLRHEPALALAFGLPAIAFGLSLAPNLLALLARRPAPPPAAALVVGTAFALVLPGLVATAGSASPLLFVPHAVGVAAGAILRPRTLGALLPACLLALSATLWSTGAGPGPVLVQVFLLAGFSMLGRALLFGAVQAAALRADARIDAELLRWVDDAHLFRLVGGQSPVVGDDGEMEEPSGGEKRVIASAEAVREGLYRLLRLGQTALRPDGAFVYLLDPSGTSLLLKEQALIVDDNGKERLSARADPLALALKKHRPVRLCDPQRDDLSPHRAGPVRSLLVVPLSDRAGAIGVLAFDRATARPFTEEDEGVALGLAEEMVHLMRTERLLHTLDEERKEKARVFQAARAFGGVVKKEEAVKVALKAVQKVAPAHVACFVEVVKVSGRDRLVVRGAGGEGASAFLQSDLTGREGVALDPETWVGRAITQGTMLPHTPLSQTGVRRGVFVEGDDRAARCGDLRALPLFAQGESVGALVVLAPEGVRLSRSCLDGVGVVADLAGVAFAGAGYYETLERAATTDGLTGLYNRRTMNERFADALARATRTGNPLSVILGDIDHFKSVNDTYGHQVGDDVLVGVSRTLMRCARVTDVVCRYGGEEFLLVCEHTDTAGSAHLAERIRRSIAQLRFDTDLGPLEVTGSFGVAALVDNGDDAESVTKAADEALYRAKEKGRNRVVIATPRAPGAADKERGRSVGAGP